MKKYSITLSLMLILYSLSSVQLFADVNTDLINIQHRWAKVNYTKNSKANRKIFKQLVKDSIKLSEQYETSAEINTWTGIINSSYAGVASGLSGLSYAKAAKVFFEKSIKIDGLNLDSSLKAAIEQSINKTLLSKSLLIKSPIVLPSGFENEFCSA